MSDGERDIGFRHTPVARLVEELISSPLLLTVRHWRAQMEHRHADAMPQMQLQMLTGTDTEIPTAADGLLENVPQVSPRNRLKRKREGRAICKACTVCRIRKVWAAMSAPTPREALRLQHSQTPNMDLHRPNVMANGRDVAHVWRYKWTACILKTLAVNQDHLGRPCKTWKLQLLLC